MKPHVDFRALAPAQRTKLADEVYRPIAGQLRAQVLGGEPCQACGRGFPLTVQETTNGSKLLAEVEEKLCALLLAGDDTAAALELPRVKKRLELAQREVKRLERENEELRAELARRK